MIDFDPKTPQKPQDFGKFWKIVCKLFKIQISENIFPYIIIYIKFSRVLDQAQQFSSISVEMTTMK